MASGIPVNGGNGTLECLRQAASAVSAWRAAVRASSGVAVRKAWSLESSASICARQASVNSRLEVLPSRNRAEASCKVRSVSVVIRYKTPPWPAVWREASEELPSFQHRWDAEHVCLGSRGVRQQLVRRQRSPADIGA